MIRKNSSQNRFKTAAARIPFSRKLPRDFFPPQKHSSDEYSRLESIWSRYNTAGQNNKKQNLQFTFRRVASEQKIEKTIKISAGLEKYNPNVRYSILPSLKIKDKNHLPKLSKLPAKFIKVTFPDISQLEN